MKSLESVIVLGILAALASTAQAQQGQGQAPAPNSAAAINASMMPQPHTQGNVSYVSGGVTSEDRDALRSMASQYNLRMLFAMARSGEYVSGVNVKVADAQGATVLDATSDGPMFYAHLPPGRYKVAAMNGDQAVTHDVIVAADHATTQNFYWPEAK